MLSVQKIKELAEECRVTGDLPPQALFLIYRCCETDRLDAYPELIAQVERLKSENENLRKQVEHMSLTWRDR